MIAHNLSLPSSEKPRPPVSCVLLWKLLRLTDELGYPLIYFQCLISNADAVLMAFADRPEVKYDESIAASWAAAAASLDKLKQQAGR